MLLYIMFPKIGKYLILRHKKKKLANHISGNISTFNDIGGIVGLFKPEIGDIIFFHDHSGIYLLHAKIILPKNEKVNNAPMSLPNENKEEKKEKKNKGKFNQQLDKPHSPKEAKPIQAQEEVKENIRDVIKKEIDNAIKTTVLPVIEHHMSQFENEFHTLISNEIATLRKTVEEESTKMQSTGKVFEMFMERMLDISGKFTGNLESQMKDLALSVRPQSDPKPPYTAPPAGYGTAYRNQTDYPNMYPGMYGNT